MLMGLHMGSFFQKMSTKPTFLILFSNYIFYIFLLKIIFELKRRPLSRETKLKERIQQFGLISETFSETSDDINHFYAI